MGVFINYRWRHVWTCRLLVLVWRCRDKGLVATFSMTTMVESTGTGTAPIKTGQFLIWPQPQLPHLGRQRVKTNKKLNTIHLSVIFNNIYIYIYIQCGFLSIRFSCVSCSRIFFFLPLFRINAPGHIWCLCVSLRLPAFEVDKRVCYDSCKLSTQPTDRGRERIAVISNRKKLYQQKKKTKKKRPNTIAHIWAQYISFDHFQHKHHP